MQVRGQLETLPAVEGQHLRRLLAATLSHRPRTTGRNNPFRVADALAQVTFRVVGTLEQVTTGLIDIIGTPGRRGDVQRCGLLDGRQKRSLKRRQRIRTHFGIVPQPRLVVKLHRLPPGRSLPLQETVGHPGWRRGCHTIVHSALLALFADWKKFLKGDLVSLLAQRLELWPSVLGLPAEMVEQAVKVPVPVHFSVHELLHKLLLRPVPDHLTGRVREHRCHGVPLPRSAQQVRLQQFDCGTRRLDDHTHTEPQSLGESAVSPLPKHAVADVVESIGKVQGLDQKRIHLVVVVQGLDPCLGHCPE
mmetsp:Transcript_29644/g.78543  ORF Transcript_29644/g.78543 Transcript_29644/m.78543 type:complete len:305 (-) Transcript_29644:2150-3064(-)